MEMICENADKCEKECGHNIKHGMCYECKTYCLKKKINGLPFKCIPYSEYLARKEKMGEDEMEFRKLLNELDWIEIDSKNWHDIPLDIFDSDKYEYEFKYYNDNTNTIKDEKLQRISIKSDEYGISFFSITGRGFSDCRYRIKQKPEPREYTHEEIMTLWFNTDRGWFKVFNFIGKDKYVLGNVGIGVYKKDWFTGRESAIVPPESL